MSEARSVAELHRLEESNAAWDAFWAADAKSSRLMTAAKRAEELSVRLLRVALDAANAADLAKAVTADAWQQFPQEGER